MNSPNGHNNRASQCLGVTLANVALKPCKANGCIARSFRGS